MYSAGHILIMPKNNWNNATTYQILDAVRHDGKAYLSKINNNTNHTPSGSTDNYWFLFAEDGFTPSVTASKTGKDTTITYTNRSGSSTSHVFDGEDGADGVSVTNITKTGSQTVDGRVVDTYTVTYSNSTTSTFQVVNGKDGTGVGDMEKSVYDKDNDGIVDGVLGNTSLIQDTVGFISKNLIPFPYYEGQTATKNGITYTVDSNGVITSNGTATGQSRFYLFLHSHGKFVDGGKEYIISGVENVGNNIEFAIALFKGNTYINKLYLQKNVTNEVKFQVDSTVDYDGIDVYILIPNGVTVSNLVFRPMLRKADIMDSTYEQYNPSVKQVLRNNKIIEGKNLIPYPYYQTTHTDAGITFTDNGDGTIKINGTATADVYFTMYRYSQEPILEQGIYILTGCPANNPSNGYDLYIHERNADNTVWANAFRDYGSGVEYIRNNNNHYGFLIQVKNGQTVNNLVFKPMLRKATETDPTYEKYYIPGVVSQEAQNILGAKNLLDNTAVTVTKNGVTMTVNEDKTVTLNGTASEQCIFFITKSFGSESVETRYIDSTKQYILSGCPIGGADNKYFIYDGLNNSKDFGDGIVLSGKSTYNASIYVRSGVTLSNVIFKPMLRLAEIQDDTYVSYAKTNKELTEIVQDLLTRVKALES